MKFMKLMILFVFVVSLFFVVFCISKPADETLKAEIDLEELQLRARHVTKEFRQLIDLNFSDEKWDRLGLLFAQNGAVLQEDDVEITGRDAIAGLFFKYKDRALIISDMELSKPRKIEAVINGYKVDYYWNVKFIMKFELKQGERVLKNQEVPGEMFIFHREICWP